MFTAKPLLEKIIKFGRSTHGEFLQDEPQVFCKDMWYLGYGKIATMPSVNVEYSSEAAKRLKELKELKGYVSHWVVNGDPGGMINRSRSSGKRSTSYDKVLPRAIDQSNVGTMG